MLCKCYRKNIGTRTVVTAILALFIYLTIGGCEKRTIIEPTEGIKLAAPQQIRVLLLNNTKHCALTPQESFTVFDADSGISARFSKQNGQVNVSLINGRVTIGGHTFGSRIEIKTESPFLARVNNALYRGNFTITANNDGQSFDLVNTLPIESYLAGVVGAEMPAYWEIEALKTQAVAARTYCMFIKKRFGVRRHWDVKSTQASQVYKGLAAESFNVNNAIEQTKGMVLTTAHKDGKYDIFPTYYSSTCGGHTENSANVFGDSYPSLKGAPCPHCKDVAQPQLLFWPAIEFPAAQVNASLLAKYPNLATLGGIADIKPSKVSNYGNGGRINSVRIVGQNGKALTIRGEDLRLTIDPTGKKIKSTFCNIAKTGDSYKFFAGRGFGHGVGMCQYGAQALARKGKNFKQILQYYYPSSKIVTKG